VHVLTYSENLAFGPKPGFKIKVGLGPGLGRVWASKLGSFTTLRFTALGQVDMAKYYLCILMPMCFKLLKCFMQILERKFYHSWGIPYGICKCKQKSRRNCVEIKMCIFKLCLIKSWGCVLSSQHSYTV